MTDSSVCSWRVFTVKAQTKMITLKIIDPIPDGGTEVCYLEPPTARKVYFLHGRVRPRGFR